MGARDAFARNWQMGQLWAMVNTSSQMIVGLFLRRYPLILTVISCSLGPLDVTDQWSTLNRQQVGYVLKRGQSWPKRLGKSWP